MKYEVTNWISALTEQRAKDSGCIPWSYEWILRLAGLSCDFTRFQEEFNLQAQGKGANHFSNIAAAISARYPSVEFKWQGFPKGEGKRKIEELKKRVSGGTLCAYSLAMGVNGHDLRCHIMPVVAVDDNHITVVFAFEAVARKAVLWKIPDSYAVHVHDTVTGGDDFTWLERY